MAAESQTSTLVTDEMREREGVWGPKRAFPPIAASDIRKWAIAVYWPEKPPPIYYDEEYASGTRWGGIVAPSYFNPFAWPVDREVSAVRSIPMGSGTQGMNGG